MEKDHAFRRNEYAEYEYVLDGQHMTSSEASRYLLAAGFNQREAVEYKAALWLNAD